MIRWTDAESKAVTIIAISIGILCSCVHPVPAHAKVTTEIQLSGLSYHWDRGTVRKYDLQETNLGIGVKHNWPSNFIAYGGYSNSYHKPSYYIFYGRPIYKGRIELGLMAGFVSGYKRDTGMAITPCLIPYGKMGPINIIVTPWFTAASVTVWEFR